MKNAGISSDNTGAGLVDRQGSRVDCRPTESHSSDNTYSLNSLSAEGCLEKQWMPETEAGERSMSVPFPGSEVRSEPFERLLQSFIGEVSVDFSGRYVAVIEGALHEQQIGSGRVEVSRERVPQAVRRDVLLDSCLTEPVSKTLRDLPRAEPCSARGNEQRGDFGTCQSAAFLEVAPQQCSKGRLQELGLWDTSLAHDPYVFAVEVDVVDVQVYQFRNSYSGAEEEFDDGPVTASKWAGAIMQFLE